MSYNVAVLLASYNGDRFINEQLSSIVSQNKVVSSIFISDDFSTDRTLERLADFQRDYSNRLFFIHGCKPPALALRNSANNFYYLITNTILSSEIEWVSFSDQDDIWLPDHLFNAITLLKKTNFQGYSSSVLAFWSNGTRRFVKKNGFIPPFNHLFESPGPGCTIVLPRLVFDQLQEHFRLNLIQLSRIKFHDWAIFAYVRSRGGQWIIGSEPALMYRQHDANVLGVQLGFKNLLKRMTLLSGGWYRNQVLAIAELCNQQELNLIQAIMRLSLFDRIKLCLSSFVLRRRIRDKFILCCTFLIMRKCH